jgi:hypothetical protein
MDIHGVIGIMKRVHDKEGWNLGSASTREQRNYFLERVCGIVHWGHAEYNPAPDPQWHCKDADGPAGGRPPSDDVVVSMPSRTMYDCIPGCGADGYRFSPSHGELLDTAQYVFVPVMPKATDGPNVPHVPAGRTPASTPTRSFPAYPGDGPFNALAKLILADYARKGEAPNEGVGQWFGRTVYDWAVGNEASLDASIRKHRAEWCAILGIPVP